MKMGIEAQRRVAVATAEGNHSYGQLLASAWQLSNTLLEDNLLKPSVDESVGDVKSRITAYPSMGSKQTTNGTISQLLRKMNDITSLNGARIGIMSKPSAEFVAGIWATWISGAVAVPLALSHPKTEILYVMNDADVSFVMGTEEYQGLLEGIAKECSARFCLIPFVPKLPMGFRTSEVFQSREVKHDSSGILSEEVLAAVKKLAVVDGDKPALIVYTSGTTGPNLNGSMGVYTH
jgi:malonyl-CoA/methylmalonyl-CoA synthetase